MLTLPPSHPPNVSLHQVSSKQQHPDLLLQFPPLPVRTHRQWKTSPGAWDDDVSVALAQLQTQLCLK